MVIHTFGAYYGLSISWVVYRPNLDKSKTLNGSVYHSDVFAMIGKSINLVINIGQLVCIIFCYWTARHSMQKLALPNTQMDTDAKINWRLWYCLHFPSWHPVQAPSSCGCSGQVSTLPLLIMETVSTELPSTHTWPWPPPFSLQSPYPACLRKQGN